MISSLPSPSPSSSSEPSADSSQVRVVAPQSGETRGFGPLALGVVAAALLLLTATWAYLVFLQPEDSSWEALADSRSSTLALIGSLVPAVMLLAVTIPRLPVRTLALLPVALAVNITLGQIVGTMGLPLPLYLDSIGTVLVGALAGPVAGATCGLLSAMVWGTFNPTIVPFALVYAFIGLASGLIWRWWAGPWWRVALMGIGFGFISAVLAAPVASFIFGGTAGTGTGLLVTFFRSLGFEPLTAVFIQSWISDPLDKLIVFSLVWFIYRALPIRTRSRFAPGAH